MTLKFQTLTNKEFTMEVQPSETIGNLKALIETMQGVPTAQQRLIWRDRTLKNDMDLNDDTKTVQ